jgi:hypothetical protein
MLCEPDWTNFGPEQVTILAAIGKNCSKRKNGGVPSDHKK